MLQRIQTIYMILALLLSGLVAFFVSFWNDEEGVGVDLQELLFSKEPFLQSIPVLFMLSAMLSFIVIISFKNRSRQISINRINIVINFLLLGIIVYDLLSLPGEGLLSEKGIGVFMPLVVIVLLVLANKAIIKDEKLVKSVDRLR